MEGNETYFADSGRREIYRMMEISQNDRKLEEEMVTPRTQKYRFLDLDTVYRCFQNSFEVLLLSLMRG